MKFEKIELTNLDQILQSHAYDFQQATESLPSLRRKMVEKKAFYEKVEASLYLGLRRLFEKEGTKFTEGKLTAEIKVDKNFIAAQSEYYDAKEEYDKVDYLREVFMQREMSIKHLVSLYGSQYWSLSSIEKAQPVTASKKKSESTEKAGFKRRGK